MIEYEDEEPAIRPMFAAACAHHGIEVPMPPVGVGAGR
jgi:hypothetical protein